MPTEALLRLYSYRSVNGSLVHLRLGENLYALFARSCCLNTNSDTWLVLLIQQPPASSPAASDISITGAPILLRGRTGSRRLKGGREEKKEEFLPDTAWMSNCPFGFLGLLTAHMSICGAGSQINPFSGALSKFLNFRKSHAWITNVR